MRVPNGVVLEINKFVSIFNSLLQNLGREPTLEEIAEEM
jgi:DNA-directed RNA polymerase sigma subunit (sigma70/sigma32)